MLAYVYMLCFIYIGIANAMRSACFVMVEEPRNAEPKDTSPLGTQIPNTGYYAELIDPWVCEGATATG